MAKIKYTRADIFKSLDELENTRGIKASTVIDALKEALEKSYKKNYLCTEANVRVEINPKNFKIDLFEIREVVDDVNDEDLEISLEEAQEINSKYKLGDLVETKVSPEVFGRLAASQVKQILRQKIREAEKDSLYKEYENSQYEIITGKIERVEPKFAIINIGRMGAFLSIKDQIPNEKLVEGQNIQVYVTSVENNPKGTHVNVSRVDPALITRLFEKEVPELKTGEVVVKGVSREAGDRSKIAVYATKEGIDAIGACVGPKGTRVRNVVNELNGEMIDIVQYSSNPEVFISNALSPAEVLKVIVEGENSATVVVPDNQFTLAIGKKGQNVRLAVRLTEWKIDIKSESEARSEGIELDNAPTYVEEFEEVEQIEELEEIEEVVEEVEEVEETEVVEETIEEVKEVVTETKKEVKEPLFDPKTQRSSLESLFDTKPAKKAPTTVNKAKVEQEKEEENVQPEKTIVEKMPIYGKDEDYDYEFDDDDLSKYDEEIDYDEYDKYYDED